MSRRPRRHATRNPAAQVFERRELFPTPIQRLDVLDHIDAVALHVRVCAAAGVASVPTAIPKVDAEKPWRPSTAISSLSVTQSAEDPQLVFATPEGRISLRWTLRPRSRSNASSQVGLTKQMGSHLSPNSFHVAVTHQDLVGVAAEVADGLQHDASHPQLPGQLPV